MIYFKKMKMQSSSDFQKLKGFITSRPACTTGKFKRSPSGRRKTVPGTNMNPFPKEQKSLEMVPIWLNNMFLTIYICFKYDYISK